MIADIYGKTRCLMGQSGIIWLCLIYNLYIVIMMINYLNNCSVNGVVFGNVHTSKIRSFALLYIVFVGGSHLD